MASKPILFSTPMVQAILDGRKTQTRRVINPSRKQINFMGDMDIRSLVRPDELTEEWLQLRSENGSPVTCIKVPYQLGDILWVRETWCNYNNKFYYKADKKCYGCTEDGICLPEGVAKHITCELCEDRDGYIKWRPSIHMPREAARIFLRVTNVRVERVQEITENDAKNEGVKDPYDYQEPSYYDQPHVRGMEINKSAFAGLWDSLNAKRGYGWDTNPWVWVYEFERVSEDED